MEKLLKRKIDSFLVEQKKQSDRMLLIVRGARQIGKRGCGHFLALMSYINVGCGTDWYKYFTKMQNN